MEREQAKERVLQELHLITEYLNAVQEPDATFMRIHGRLLLGHIEDMSQVKVVVRAA